MWQGWRSVRRKRWTTQAESNENRDEVSIGWRDFFRVFCSVWVTLVCSVVSSESALIGSSSPVSRSSSSSNYTSFSQPVLSGFAFLFLLWLGSATDYSTHTPTTTPFQYRGGCLQGGQEEFFFTGDGSIRFEVSREIIPTCCQYEYFFWLTTKEQFPYCPYSSCLRLLYDCHEWHRPLRIRIQVKV